MSCPMLATCLSHPQWARMNSSREAQFLIINYSNKATNTIFRGMISTVVYLREQLTLHSLTKNSLTMLNCPTSGMKSHDVGTKDRSISASSNSGTKRHEFGSIGFPIDCYIMAGFNIGNIWTKILCHIVTPKATQDSCIAEQIFLLKIGPMVISFWAIHRTYDALQTKNLPKNLS